MLSDLYVFDLQTYTWAKVEPAPDSIVPGPRYFHSSDTCKSWLRDFLHLRYLRLPREQPSSNLWRDGLQNQ